MMNPRVLRFPYDKGWLLFSKYISIHLCYDYILMEFLRIYTMSCIFIIEILHVFIWFIQINKLVYKGFQSILRTHVVKYKKICLRVIQGIWLQIIWSPTNVLGPNGNKRQHSTLFGSPSNFIFLFFTIQLYKVHFACLTSISTY